MEGKVLNPTNTSSVPDMLVVSSSPHIRSNESVKRIMLDVIIALVPAAIGSVYFFGLNALKLILLSIASALFFEAAIQKLFKKEVTINDYSAIITGILIAFNLPANAPWWIPVFGSGFAIIIVKQCFGGIGSNFMNPALAARAVLLASWPNIMSNFVLPGVDAVTGSTPLAIMKYGGADAGASATVAQAVQELPSIMNMFIGNRGGAIGETSALLLLIGALYLIVRKVINWKTPVIYIGTTAILLLILGVEMNQLMYHILGGGLILGAFFMATDYSTTPVTSRGQIIFALGAGILTALIRVKGGFPEGVSYSILLMNVASPLIEKFTAPKIFGRAK
ncbi:RnfABCDGE type electron transport complex subunit D [Tissierella sp. MB52-C2]|uniref:RnfABCDGE type electron transport complex subunit D n=1 Tax=Tissierella sp. MB52-C2 TaxID=3070999 RepID=UPI00280B8046|nr:RnfABCDGE type electron transport complex subunit D [Tissierella sp. MB52-C2]WMM23567.1 RnfABCDGE type electron transport complex subunit D [Tissierella sp. MB52-C2]